MKLQIVSEHFTRRRACKRRDAIRESQRAARRRGALAKTELDALTELGVEVTDSVRVERVGMMRWAVIAS